LPTSGRFLLDTPRRSASTLAHDLRSPKRKTKKNGFLSGCTGLKRVVIPKGSTIVRRVMETQRHVVEIRRGAGCSHRTARRTAHRAVTEATKDWMKLAGLRAACFKGCGRRPKLIRAKWNEELRAYSVLPSARGPTAGGIPHCSRCCAGGCLGFDAGGKQDRVAEGDDACCVHCKAQSERYSSDNVQPSFSVLLSSRRG